MITHKKIFDLIETLHPLHRSLNSDGTSQAYRIIQRYMPKEIPFKILRFNPGAKAWDWQIPPRFTVNKAVLVAPSGEEIVNFKNNPLHIVSYSQSYQGSCTFSQLKPHLHYSNKYPDAIPWVTSYYHSDWGLCLTKNDYNTIAKLRGKFTIDIQTKFDYTTEFEVAEAYWEVDPDFDDLIVVANVCHPYQVNDSITGVACAVHVAHSLVDQNQKAGLRKDIRFLFCPERIGSIVYLSHNSHLIKKMSGGIFAEFLGNKDLLNLQYSNTESAEIDLIAKQIFAERDIKFTERPSEPWNDESVFNGNGVHVPMIFVSRTTNRDVDYYHTSLDTPANLDANHLFEAIELVSTIIEAAAQNYVPKFKIKKGPVFLSKRNLWIDWHKDKGQHLLNFLQERLLLRIDGKTNLISLLQQINRCPDLPTNSFAEALAVLEPLVAGGVLEKR